MVSRTMVLLTISFSFFLIASAAAQQSTGVVGSQETGILSAPVARLLNDAEEGDAEAQFGIGVHYQSGRELQRDAAEAAKWFRKAAEQGHPGAQVNLGQMYSMGIGVARDPAVAAEWFRRAAEYGHPLAQYYLGFMLQQGQGVGQDALQSYKWLVLSEAGGSRNAAQLREQVAGRMTPEQIVEAQRQAKEWKPRESKYPLAGLAGTGMGRAGQVTPPIALSQPMPSYTDAARRARIEGTVLVRCIFRKDGTVSVEKVLRGLGYGLDESAAKMIREKWRFKPGTRNGEPVDVQADIEVLFKLY